MVYGLSIELEGASPLFSTAGQVKAAGLPIVSGIGRRVDRAGGSVIVTMHVSIVIGAVSIMCQTETDLAGTVTVRVRCGHWWTRVRVRMAETVTVRRRCKMTC